MVSNTLLKQEDYSHLNLDWNNIDWDRLYRPFTDYRSEEQYVEILKAIRDIRNLYFTCKYVLNIDPAVFQIVCLETLFKYPFPMLTASRGLSKSFMLAMFSLLRSLVIQGSRIIIVGAAFRQSKVIFQYMEDIWNRAPILRDICGDDSGPRRQTDEWVFKLGDSRVVAIPMGDGCLSLHTNTLRQNSFGTIAEECSCDQITKTNSYVWGNGQFRFTNESYRNGIQKTKIVTTDKGYSFEGTYNHGIKIIRNGVIDFIRTDEIKIGDYLLIDRSWRWHDGNVYDISVDDAYFLGAMIGDGSYCNKYYLQFTNIDKELIDNVKNISNYNWKCNDGVHYKAYGKDLVNEFLHKFSLQLTYTKDKIFPSIIRSSQRELMTACLQGLFDTDGTLQVSYAKGGVSVSISITNTSKILMEQLQFILLHYSIISCLKYRDRNKKWNRSYELLITGSNARLFAHYIGFRLSRKQNILMDGISAQQRDNNYEHIPFIKELMLEITKLYKGFPNKNKIEHISYSHIEKTINVNHNFVDRFLCRYKDLDDDRKNIIRKLSNKNIFYDQVVSIQNGESETFDIHVPNGNEYCANGFFSHNSKIRGQRANCVIADEFQSLAELIYEVVVANFANVSASPSENVKRFAKIKYLKEQGLLTKEPETVTGGIYRGNQMILSGTGDWGFKHFAKYWKRYRAIINSQGDENKLREIFAGEVESAFDWKDYAIIRIPVELAPPGFMEDKHVQRAKATVGTSVYMQEYGACYPEDSDKFYRRSLIESCVTNEIIHLPSGPVQFHAVTKGIRGRKYIYGIDPASESNNFAIVILEIHEDHRRVVYCWTTNRERHMAKVKHRIVDDNSFYAYCARKIRTLMQFFPAEFISMDSQGGGIGVMESLHDIKSLQSGELPIWSIQRYQGKNDNPILWPNAKDWGHDNEAGLHILEMVAMSNADYVADANHGMRKDLESKILLFPFFDPISVAEAFVEDNREKRQDDTLEDCVLEIEELKTEMTTLDHITTQTGRDKWTTPETVEEGGKKGHLRKDRYCALLTANSLARRIMLNRTISSQCSIFGGFIDQRYGNDDPKGALYTGPSWFTESASKMGIMITKNDISGPRA